MCHKNKEHLIVQLGTETKLLNHILLTVFPAKIQVTPEPVPDIPKGKIWLLDPLYSTLLPSITSSLEKTLFGNR